MITAEHVDNAIAMALAGEAPNLDPAVYDILGFATPAMRRMFSNLCNVEGAAYLECGVYAGATFCAACNNNPLRFAIGIDNFSQAWHEGRDIAKECAENRAKFCPDAFLYRADCFAPGLMHYGSVDIFYFDGDHTREAQAKALPNFFDCLASSFLFIVDDYNWPDVGVGTAEGFAALGARASIVNDWKLRGGKGQDDPIWHNGVALFLCRKL